MQLPWLLPVGVAIGVAGTRTAIRGRHGVKGRPRDASWWVLVILAWLPLICWCLAQVVEQY
jgi:hypothetical protein